MMLVTIKSINDATVCFSLKFILIPLNTFKLSSLTMIPIFPLFDFLIFLLSFVFSNLHSYKYSVISAVVYEQVGDWLNYSYCAYDEMVDVGPLLGPSNVEYCLIDKYVVVES